MRTSEILIQAKNKIELGGLQRGCWSGSGRTLFGPFGYCSVGAIGSVVSGKEEPTVSDCWTGKTLTPIKVIASVVGTYNLIRWNDRSTEEEVLAVFDRAIEIVLAQEQEFNVIDCDKVQAEDAKVILDNAGSSPATLVVASLS